MEQQRVLRRTRLTVEPEGMAVVGVPVGTEQYQRHFVQDAVHDKPAALMPALVSMEDSQASFQILRLSAAATSHSCCG